VREYAASVSGAGAVECIPDEFVRSGEVVLVDVPPEVVRRRILSGRVYDTQRVGGALAHYFRTANLEALGELARAWMADNVQEVGDEILLCGGFADSEPRPLVLAGVSGSDWGEVVLRRAADVAAEEDADLHVAHVTLADGVAHRVGPMLDRYRQETARLGGTYTEVEGRDPAHGLATAAEARGASWVVVARHRGRLGELARGSVASRLHRLLPDTRIDIVRREG
jgi:two-component system sensor histidine kinase KdpD